MTMVRGAVARTAVATKIVAADGTGDFTDIQTAIDSLPAGGGVVYVKEGTYTITSSLTIGVDNTAIIGAGRATKIQTSSAIDMLKATNKDFLFISQILLVGNDTDIGNKGIEFNSCEDCTINNCWIQDTGGIGIEMANVSVRAIITNNHVNGGKREGIRINGAVDCIIDNNTVKDSILTGITVTLSENSNSIISNNSSVSVENSGISIVISSGVIVIGNSLNKNGATGINIQQSNDCVVDGNICNNNGQNSQGRGIFIQGSAGNPGQHNVIINNICVDNQGTATQLIGINESSSNVDKNLFLGNICHGNSSSQITLNGANSNEGHNISS